MGTDVAALNERFRGYPESQGLWWVTPPFAQPRRDKARAATAGALFTLFANRTHGDDKRDVPRGPKVHGKDLEQNFADWHVTDPFAEADADTGDTKQSSQNYIHIRIQREYSPCPLLLRSAGRIPPRHQEISIH